MSGPQLSTFIKQGYFKGLMKLHLFTNANAAIPPKIVCKRILKKVKPSTFFKFSFQHPTQANEKDLSQFMFKILLKMNKLRTFESLSTIAETKKDAQCVYHFLKNAKTLKDFKLSI
jgi:hypothetical protein